jgi:hypothetical protein
VESPYPKLSSPRSRSGSVASAKSKVSTCSVLIFVISTRGASRSVFLRARISLTLSQWSVRTVNLLTASLAGLRFPLWSGATELVLLFIAACVGLVSRVACDFLRVVLPAPSRSPQLEISV